MEFTLALLLTTTLIFSSLAFYFFISLQKKSDEYLSLANKSDFFHKKAIMRPEEYSEYKRLIATENPSKYLVIPQAPLTMFIGIKESFKDHNNLYNALGKKSVDFLIVDKKTLEPVKVIELNGKSHLATGRRNRDAEVANILEKIGVEYQAINL